MASKHVVKLVTAVALAWPAVVLAQQPIIYPAKGQGPQQQDKDMGECQVWAQKSTGIDPVAVSSQPAPQQGGERVRGAARGAAGGAVVGAIAGDAGKGAAVGAVAGTMVGGHRSRQNQAAAQQQASAQQQQLATYSRAYGACMEGRGYTVK